MSKGSKTPAAPDPAQVATAQAEANRVNIITPTGSQVYGNWTAKTRPQDVSETDWNSRPFDQRYDFTVDPKHSVMQIQETPAQRQFREQQEQIAQDLARRASEQVAALPIQSGINVPQMANGTGAIQRAFDTNNDRVNAALGRGIIGSVDKSDFANFVSQVDTSGMGDYQRGVDLRGLGDYTTRVDRSNLAAIPGTNDLVGAAGATQQAVYERARMAFAPEVADRRRQIEQRLADQGIPVGSEAYTREMERLGRTENDLLARAALDSVTAGAGEQERLTRLAMALRDQGFGENLTDAELANRARAAAFGENYQNLGANNTVRQTLFGEGLTQAELSNKVRAQQLAEALSEAELNNAAQAQEFAQAQSAGAQEFGQAMQKAQFGNTASQQDFQNALTARATNFNELAALLNGPQVASPGMMAPPQIDVTGPMNAAYQGQIAAAQNRQSGMNAALGALGTVGGMYFFCFDGDEPVDMADGSAKPIRDMKIGDRTRGGEVLAVLEARGGPMARYRGVRVSPNHPVRCHDGRWRMVGDTPEARADGEVERVWSLYTTEGRIHVRGIEFSDHDPAYGRPSSMAYQGVTLMQLDAAAV